MGFKSIFSSLFPLILFFIAFIIIYNSSMVLPKVIDVQYKIFEIFMNNLKENDLSYSSNKVFHYLWVNIFSYLLLSFALIAFGTIITIKYIEEINPKLVVIGSIISVASTFLVTNSVEILIAFIALAISNILTIRFFEPKKYSIITGYSYIAKNLGMVGLFLSLGILVAMSANANAYEKAVHDSTAKTISLLLPNQDEIINAQKEKVRTDSEFIRSYIKYSHDSLPEDSRKGCEGVYTGCLTAVNEYENASLKAIDRNGINLAVQDLENSFPVIKSFEKTTPIFISIFVLTSAGFLNPIISIFGGFIYLILKTTEQKNMKKSSTK